MLMFGWDFQLMLSRDSEDEMWSRFVFELVIWPQEVTLVRWTQPSARVRCAFGNVFFLSLFDFVVLLSLASLFITALALSGQSEKAAIFCKGCYAALHGHRSRYKFVFSVQISGMFCHFMIDNLFFGHKIVGHYVCQVKVNRSSGLLSIPRQLVRLQVPRMWSQGLFAGLRLNIFWRPILYTNKGPSIYYVIQIWGPERPPPPL